MVKRVILALALLIGLGTANISSAQPDDPWPTCGPCDWDK